MAATIEILPKRQFTATYTQSTADAVDILPFNTYALQVWLDETLSGSEHVNIYVQHASVNEDDAFVNYGTAGSAVLQFTSTSTSPQLTPSSFDLARYVRLKVELTGGTTVATVRAEMLFKAS